MKYLTDMVGSVAKFTAESIDIESASNSLAWLRGNKNLIVRFQLTPGSQSSRTGQRCLRKKVVLGNGDLD